MENKRNYRYDLMPVIKERWSPRGFDPNVKMTMDDIFPLLEAATYAPSCFNEQPWRFIVGTEGEKKEKIFDALMEKNQRWAKNASALMIICCHTKFERNNKDNAYAKFDTGTSWGLFSLQAVNNGFHTHAMAGYDKAKIKESFHLPDDIEPIAAVAIGKLAGLEYLPEEFHDDESPSTRNAIENVLID